MNIDKQLDFLGVIARQPQPKPTIKPAADAAPQWKPTYPGEDPPF
jgi:hypothetical protein